MSQTAAVPSSPQAQAGDGRPPMQLVEDSDEVISPEESNVPERANEINSEPLSSFTSEGSDNVNRNLQVLPSTVSTPIELLVSELEIDTVPRAVENNLDQGLSAVETNSDQRRYPSRVHHPPARYNDFVKI